MLSPSNLFSHHNLLLLFLMRQEYRTCKPDNIIPLSCVGRLQFTSESIKVSLYCPLRAIQLITFPPSMMKKNLELLVKSQNMMIFTQIFTYDYNLMDSILLQNIYKNFGSIF